MSDEIELISATKSFSGWLKRYKHQSNTLCCEMFFSIYLPPAAEVKAVSTLWWLSGLTSNDENFMREAGAHRVAAELDLALICPDTSPRGTNLPGEHDRYDFGSSAGFYVNATEAPWNEHYRMYDYVTEELPTLVKTHFPLNGKEAISGHSMGGHGAMICALKNPQRYTSVSAFAPISNPTRCPWGEFAFSGYLGEDRESWNEWDACELVRQNGSALELLVDQGDADNFYQEGQLRPEALQQACKEAEVPLTLRMQPGYDHFYSFVASFIDDHLRYHAHHLE
ncbi:S-formylglutathione hydrolase [Alcanivoracaceae bacterium MT1]